MQNFQHITDADLLSRTLDLARRERAITLEILYHLREISDRRLYAAWSDPL